MHAYKMIPKSLQWLNTKWTYKVLNSPNPFKNPRLQQYFSSICILIYGQELFSLLKIYMLKFTHRDSRNHTVSLSAYLAQLGLIEKYAFLEY